MHTRTRQNTQKWHGPANTAWCRHDWPNQKVRTNNQSPFHTETALALLNILEVKSWGGKRRGGEGGGPEGREG